MNALGCLVIKRFMRERPNDGEGHDCGNFPRTVFRGKIVR